MSLQSDFGPGAARERIHNSVEVDLEGRFMLASGAEHPCRIVAMSTGEMLFSTPVRPRLGEKVIVYIAELGRFEGGVSRHEGEGFAIGLKLTEMKHRKLAEQLVWFANRDVLDLPENRRHKRIVPMLQWTIVRLSNGKEKTAKINDISLSGVSVEVNARPLVGGRVMVGSKAAKVVRLVDGGFVAEFEEPFAEGELDERIRL
ncbi:PilZ domain-containing protein [Methylocystis sp. WRRC1]|uniref:PilZ domain-containing protein n=1 Tax=Methylocystis sp. WRRC1 TaxID=1732014 RepID=UPI001D134CBF|nr:PilZ domain-containing protein [Methylocystis sp. WRRC1]MCC3245263.1 PilZ domain-containing protein [Methylocystis sp. WRRC1]